MRIFAKRAIRRDAVKRGFTMIEVLLVLAISVSIFAGMAAYMSVSVSRSRYNDSVNDVVSYLRGVYSSVINVENGRTGTEGSSKYCTISSLRDASGNIVENSTSDNYPGRSGCAVYGKLVTFGENDKDIIRTYDVIGTIYDSNFSIDDLIVTDSDVLAALKKVGANVVTVGRETSKCSVSYAGQYDYHETLWLARMQDVSGAVFRGALLVVRSPISGTVHTYHYTGTGDLMQVQDFIAHAAVTNAACTSAYIAANYSSDVLLKKAIDDSALKAEDITFCIDSEDATAHGNTRRGIKIHADGQNDSAVELLALDSEDNPCR